MTDTATIAALDPAPAHASASPSTPATARSAPQPGIRITAPVAAGLLAVLMGWGAWVTKEVRTLRTGEPQVASMSVEPLISEYIAAQARSGLPPAQAAGQTQAFMKALEDEIKARASRGQTILMAEAVLSKNVNDITPQVRSAVYAKVPMPPALRQITAAPTMAVPMGQPAMAAAPVPMVMGNGNR